MTQLVAATRRVAREVPGGAEAVTALGSTVNYAQPGDRRQLVDTLVRDALAVLAALTSDDTTS
jgi:hypothetical protein